MPLQTFDFEKPIVDAVEEIDGLRAKLGDLAAVDAAEVEKAQGRLKKKEELEAKRAKALEARQAAEAKAAAESEEGDEADPPATVEVEIEVIEEGEELSEADTEILKHAEDLKRLRDLEQSHDALRKEVYGNLSAWSRVQIARHRDRPRALDFIEQLVEDWTELKGDRYFSDDLAAVCGLGCLGGEPVAIIGQQKGHDTKENVERNFGMMHPEGYRKAMRVMRIAERFDLPVIVLIDTPGAYPGIGAEERGQSEAIARNIMEMFTLRMPIIGVIIGEGASGGALGVGVVDYMMMLENSWYCVISPEGCASILYRDAGQAPHSAEVLKLTSEHLEKFKIADETVPEPEGGAHHDGQQAIENLRAPLLKQIKRLKKKKMETLLAERFEKYRSIGVVVE